MSSVASPKADPQQLDLFAGFGLPEIQASPPVRRQRAKPLRRTAAKVVQLVMDLRARSEEADDWAERWVSRPVVHAVVPAASTKMPETRGAASIFDLGYLYAAEKVISEFMLSQEDAQEAQPAPAPAIQDRIHTDITRDVGIVRCKRLHHTDTQEWQEREAARRARQRPPRPGAKYKTMSEKLKEVI